MPTSVVREGGGRGEGCCPPPESPTCGPGGDLESVAGQVACGCNVVFFTTGNGSITNFPFVPTVKVVTTTRRFEFLRKGQGRRLTD